MIPVHELLNRICWEAEFARADFRIGYYDRVEYAIVIVPMKQLILA